MAASSPAAAAASPRSSAARSAALPNRPTETMKQARPPLSKKSLTLSYRNGRLSRVTVTARARSRASSMAPGVSVKSPPKLFSYSASEPTRVGVFVRSRPSFTAVSVYPTNRAIAVGSSVTGDGIVSGMDSGIIR